MKPRPDWKSSARLTVFAAWPSSCIAAIDKAMPSRGGCFHEIKHDGYGAVRSRSRYLKAMGNSSRLFGTVAVALEDCCHLAHRL